MSPAFLQRYQRLLDAVDRVVSWVIIAAMAVLTIVVVVQVFYRYVLNDSIRWGWDIPRLCFIWVLMLSIPLGIRYNAHVGIDIVVQRLSPATQRAILVFNAFFMLVLSATAAYYGVILAKDTMDQMMPGINLSVGLFYVGLAIGQIHTCMHVARILMTGRTTTDHLSET
ncbi:MAG TPA: TRAP transporter small permease [Casimicrobiaceae bacterium]|nr:TRAP transporter small permease [Casimicrobiaceae bacterium]